MIETYMKKALLSLTMAGLLAGCMTPAQKQWTCDTAAAAYGAYQATIEAGHKPSQNEVYAAAAGGAFLRLYCGWTSPITTETVTRNAVNKPVPTVDANWVPVLIPPK
jgi:hypothetical protein